MTPKLTFADRLTLAALLLAAVAAAAGQLVSGRYRDPAERVRQARAADFVTFLVAVSALAVGLSTGSSSKASMAWPRRPSTCSCRRSPTV